MTNKPTLRQLDALTLHTKKPITVLQFLYPTVQEASEAIRVLMLDKTINDLLIKRYRGQLTKSEAYSALARHLKNTKFDDVWDWLQSIQIANKLSTPGR